MLWIVYPLTFKAVETGHPEELLAAALVIGSAVSAATGASWRAILLLGLALATKQWAVIAFFPILMALPAHRVRRVSRLPGSLCFWCFRGWPPTPTASFQRRRGFRNPWGRHTLEHLVPAQPSGGVSG